MPLTYAVQANSKSISVSNTEVLITSILPISANALAVGDAFRIKLMGTLDPTSQYTLNVRLGANGNIADAAVYSNNNVVPKATLLSDLNGYANSFPGFNWNAYQFPANTSNAPGVSKTPTKFNGELILVVTGIGANGNVAVVAPPVTVDPTNLLTLLGTGVLSVANGINTTVNNNIVVSMSMVAAGGYAFTPAAGVEGPGNKWVYSQAANTSNTSVVYSLIEAL